MDGSQVICGSVVAYSVENNITDYLIMNGSLFKDADFNSVHASNIENALTKFVK